LARRGPQGAWVARAEGGFSDTFANDPLGGLSPLTYFGRHGRAPRSFQGAWAAGAEGRFSDTSANDPLGGLSPLTYLRRRGRPGRKVDSRTLLQTTLSEVSVLSLTWGGMGGHLDHSRWRGRPGRKVENPEWKVGSSDTFANDPLGGLSPLTYLGRHGWPGRKVDSRTLLQTTLSEVSVLSLI
jgi:hypothetical protein